MHFQKTDIRKSGGILIHDRKLLICKSDHNDFFVAPGGKLEGNETAQQSLVRELKEECNIDTQESDFEYFDILYAQAAGNELKRVQMEVFIVKKWEGEPQLTKDTEQFLWIDSNIQQGIKVGSIFEHEVIPRLKKLNLID